MTNANEGPRQCVEKWPLINREEIDGEVKETVHHINVHVDTGPFDGEGSRKEFVAWLKTCPVRFAFTGHMIKEEGYRVMEYRFRYPEEK